MNLTIKRVKELLISQKENQPLQYLMAQDMIIELYAVIAQYEMDCANIDGVLIEKDKRIADLLAVIDDWKLADKKEK